MKILCLIPARKNSQRLKNKNFLKINGISLVEKTIQLVQNMRELKDIVLSSDYENLKYLKRKYSKLIILKRPSKYARSQTKMKSVIEHAVNHFKKKNYNAVLVLQPTSPLRKKKTIIKAIKIFKKLQPDYLASIKKLKHNEIPTMTFKMNDLNKTKKINFKIKSENKNYYCLDGGTVFMFKIPGNYMLFGKGAFIKVEFPENIDIDNINDFSLAKKHS